MDLKEGIVPWAPNAPIRRFKVAEPIIKAFRMPVVLGNDAWQPCGASTYSASVRVLIT